MHASSRRSYVVMSDHLVGKKDLEMEDRAVPSPVDGTEEHGELADEPVAVPCAAACTRPEVAAVSSRTCRCSQYWTRSCQQTLSGVLPLAPSKAGAESLLPKARVVLVVLVRSQLEKAFRVFSPCHVSSVSFFQWSDDFNSDFKPVGTSVRN